MAVRSDTDGQRGFWVEYLEKMYTVHHLKGQLPMAGLQIVDAASLSFRESEELNLGAIYDSCSVCHFNIKFGLNWVRYIESIIVKSRKTQVMFNELPLYI